MKNINSNYGDSKIVINIIKVRELIEKTSRFEDDLGRFQFYTIVWLLKSIEKKLICEFDGAVHIAGPNLRSEN